MSSSQQDVQRPVTLLQEDKDDVQSVNENPIAEGGKLTALELADMDKQLRIMIEYRRRMREDHVADTDVATAWRLYKESCSVFEKKR